MEGSLPNQCGVELQRGSAAYMGEGSGYRVGSAYKGVRQTPGTRKIGGHILLECFLV